MLEAVRAVGSAVVMEDDGGGNGGAGGDGGDGGGLGGRGEGGVAEKEVAVKGVVMEVARAGGWVEAVTVEDSEVVAKAKATVTGVEEMAAAKAEEETVAKARPPTRARAYTPHPQS